MDVSTLRVFKWFDNAKLNFWLNNCLMPHAEIVILRAAAISAFGYVLKK